MQHAEVEPTGLPVEACVADVRTALATAGAAVLQAPPGAGKTTVVPLRLLDETWLDGGRIVVLEPRRLAARAAARRMAALLGEEVGATVGYRTRDERRVGPTTRIEVVTEGILTQQIQRDPSLAGVGLVVFDEIHERNLQADLALALVLDARPVLRPDLRLLAMSATLDTDRVAALLGSAPTVRSEGRSFPVDVRWRPPGPRDRPAEATAAAVRHALATEDGDVLVFLAGAADIRRVGALLGRAAGRGASRGGLPADVDVRPLFGALSPAEQDAALAPSPPGRRRVVLSTDIAETSLTVAGVRVVIDSGQVRTPQFDPRTGLTRLRTGPNPRASADQRAGRAGRTEPGVVFRLWSEHEHATRRAFAAPEITTVDLTGLALELARWGTASDGLAFLDPPPVVALADAQTLLAELGAVDASGRITDAGRAMADLPVHPRLARMVTQGVATGVGETACALAALLEERDVLRGRPDELPVDVADRVRLIADPRGGHPFADRAALDLVRRRAKELARRAKARTGRVEPTACGPVLALAYPDRVAQATGGGRFRLRHGAGAWLPTGDPLTGEPFLVVADLGIDPHGDRNRADHRVRMAAALDEADVERLAGADVEVVTRLEWDTARDDLRQRTERRLGALVLAVTDGPAPAGDATRGALLDQVRRAGLGVLGWSAAAATLRSRIGFAHRAFQDDWPDVADAALLATLDDWLAPRLTKATRRVDMERVDLVGALRDMVGHHRLHELDQLVPTTITVAAGRSVAIDYEGDAPSIAVRVQDLFGTTIHPTIADGRIPIVVHLLSPAGRPVQVTADLPGFWSGSWAEVRKEMAGRYPKHAWPIDPSTAEPPTRPNRRR